MASVKRFGEEFEDSFAKSIPPRVYYRKLSSPTPPPSVMQQMDPATRGRFTPKSPYDFMIAAPAPGPVLELEGRSTSGERIKYPVQPCINFALELKSTGGKSLPHDRVKPHQVSGLLVAAMSGHVAGLVVEFREVGEGECWFVPVKPYAAFRQGETARSLPYAMASTIGTQIEKDAGRGRTRTYYRVGDWLRACGAGVAVF